MEEETHRDSQTQEETERPEDGGALDAAIRERDEARSALAEAQRELEALRQEGRVRFTARMAGEGGAMTREQIMAIQDRPARRAAIAQHLNLFKKES